MWVSFHGSIALLETPFQLCSLEDVADDDAQKAHDEQEGDGETSAATGFAALFP